MKRQRPTDEGGAILSALNAARAAVRVVRFRGEETECECGLSDVTYVCAGRPRCLACTAEYLDRDVSARHLAAFAEQCCAITDMEFPVYDPERDVRPTREEYKIGHRYATSPNALRTKLRHEHTNYDCIVEYLDRDDPIDRAAYQAVLARITQLIDARLEETGNSLAYE